MKQIGKLSFRKRMVLSATTFVLSQLILWHVWHIQIHYWYRKSSVLAYVQQAVLTPFVTAEEFNKYFK